MTIQKLLYTKRTSQLSGVLVRSAATAPAHDDYQYLQRGQIPMLHFQRSLPRLPIPKLEMTCTRFLNALRPISNDAAFDEITKIVKQFSTTGSGPMLQKLLVEHDKKNKHTSYISEPWFDMYLSDRRPLPINYNPVLVMNPDSRPEYNDMLTRTANLVVTSLRFMRSLRENLLEPEVYHLSLKKSNTPRYRSIMSKTPTLIATFVSYVFKAFPLDMSQYQGLFGATRIPEMGKDRIYRSETSTHICVMRNGHIYAVNVLDPEGNILPPSSIISRLKFVLGDPSSQNAAEYPLGVLTALERDTWAGIREHLVETNGEKPLDIIDSALFCVSLDEHASYDPNNPVPIIRNMLHGDDKSLINHWFDKSFSLIVAGDGTAAVNFEHSWGDGVAVLRYFNEIFKETTASPLIQPSDVKNLVGEDVSAEVFRVELNLDAKSKNDIKDAVRTYRATVDSLQMNIMKYFEMNKDFCKLHKVSPDAIMQLGFQLAYLKQNGEYVGAYESCSTAAFRHGRTETVRPVTTLTKAFCDAIELRSASADKKELRQLIEQCSVKHGELIKEAAMGQGFDRHLFGLKFIAQKNKIPIDPLYEHDTYHRINCNLISTSTLTSPGLLAGGFGAVEANGYGVGYNIRKEFLGTVVTNYKAHTNGPEFVECLRESYDNIREVLESK